ncbi:response regulator PleD [mine drainage metagenome]|uniref:Response regulator PleD n=1 Tax=mine drainage metagenome TaxID=410659 RepID=A0A1J5RZ23_9ZZZZ
MNLIDLTKFEQLKATGDLPSPKGAALAIIRLTQREDASLAELTHAIRADPAFSGRLIKAANGVNGIGRRPIVSIQNALTVLGVPGVRSLALGFSLMSSYRGGACANFDYQRFWSHSLACGIALQALTSATHVSAPEEAFSVGLLARVGELALATLFSERYSDILERLQREPGITLFDLEQEAFVLTHDVLTASMMLDWGMPKIYSDPVCCYETLESIPFQEDSRQYKLAHLLALADVIADVCLAAQADRRQLLPRLFHLGTTLSFETDVLNQLCDKVAQDWRDWGALLKVGTAPVPLFEELSLPPKDAHAGGLRVLLVDDDQAARALLRSVLAEAGHEVFEAADGRQAFEAALDLNPQMMVLARQLPGMDGIELTRALRQTRIGRGLYVLLLAEHDDEDELIEALESGVNDFLTKPLKPRVLAARLSAAQRVARLQQELERDREEIRHTAAELEVTNRRLQEVALTDILTGFPNRRYAIERIEQEWAASQRNHRPLAAMVIDVDQFKQINDAYGHDVGDTVLRQVAAALKSGVRVQDVVCRFGGDEFLVICPDTSLEAAQACAERMRHAVEAVIIGSGTAKRSGSISVGVAVRDAAMADFDALIKRADQGVFIAKERGRNRVAAAQAEDIGIKNSGKS